VSTPPTTFLNPEQYLEIERAAEYKSEYLADLYEKLEFESPYSGSDSR
jgi:hypothetical protein